MIRLRTPVNVPLAPRGGSEIDIFFETCSNEVGLSLRSPLFVDGNQQETSCVDASTN